MLIVQGEPQSGTVKLILTWLTQIPSHNHTMFCFQHSRLLLAYNQELSNWNMSVKGEFRSWAQIPEVSIELLVWDHFIKVVAICLDLYSGVYNRNFVSFSCQEEQQVWDFSLDSIVLIHIPKQYDWTFEFLISNWQIIIVQMHGSFLHFWVHVHNSAISIPFVTGIYYFLS